MNYYERNEISNSDLTSLSISVEHFLQYRRTKKEPTPAMNFGSLVHCLALEPHNYLNEFVIMPEFNARTKDGKEEKAKFIQDYKHLKKITQEELEHANILIDVLNKNERYRNLEITHKEKEVFFEQYGVNCRSKLDIVCDNELMIYDIKTIDDISDKNIYWTLKNRNYHRQAKFYMNALKGYDFTFIFIEKEAPYSIRFIDLAESSLESAELEIERLLTRYKEYLYGELETTSFSNDTQTFYI